MITSIANIEKLIEEIVSGNPEESATARQLVLSQNGEAVPVLLELLGEATQRQCWAILSILSKLGDKRAVPHVIQCLYAEHPAVQGIAAQCLGDLGDTRAVAPMTHVLARNPESNTAIWFVQALGKIGDPSAVETLIDIVNSTSSAAVRYTAIEALGLIGDHRALPVVMNYAADENRHVRSRAVAAIDALNTHRMVPRQA